MSNKSDTPQNNSYTSRMFLEKGSTARRSRRRSFIQITLRPSVFAYTFGSGFFGSGSGFLGSGFGVLAARTAFSLLSLVSIFSTLAP